LGGGNLGEGSGAEVKEKPRRGPVMKRNVPDEIAQGGWVFKKGEKSERGGRPAEAIKGRGPTGKRSDLRIGEAYTATIVYTTRNSGENKGSSKTTSRGFEPKRGASFRERGKRKNKTVRHKSRGENRREGGRDGEKSQCLAPKLSEIVIHGQRLQKIAARFENFGEKAKKKTVQSVFMTSERAHVS